MSDATPLAEQIACVRRVYPKWVAAGRMSEAEAARELRRMHAVLRTLEQLAATETP